MTYDLEPFIEGGHLGDLGGFPEEVLSIETARARIREALAAAKPGALLRSALKGRRPPAAGSEEKGGGG